MLTLLYLTRRNSRCQASLFLKLGHDRKRGVEDWEIKLRNQNIKKRTLEPSLIKGPCSDLEREFENYFIEIITHFKLVFSFL
jgi:inhibitor of KinA sporulation pathway (predicted exonuclease)